MPVLDRIHPGVVARFVYQQLEASAAWTAIHGNRLYEDVRVPNNIESPFGVVTVIPKNIALWTGSMEYIGKMLHRVEVVSVRVYPNAASATWFDFVESYHALREALTGITYLPVTLAGVTIGTVFQSRYIEEIKRSHNDGDFNVLHHGIAIEVVSK